jgi:hypothetical protein
MAATRISVRMVGRVRIWIDRKRGVVSGVSGGEKGKRREEWECSLYHYYFLKIRKLRRRCGSWRCGPGAAVEGAAGRTAGGSAERPV